MFQVAGRTALCLEDCEATDENMKVCCELVTLKIRHYLEGVGAEWALKNFHLVEETVIESYYLAKKQLVEEHGVLPTIEKVMVRAKPYFESRYSRRIKK